VDEVAPYLGQWPESQDNLLSLAESGVAGVLWDPNGNAGDCAYTCAEAVSLVERLAAYSAAPLTLPRSACSP
jgi:hypothetical protein